MHLALLLDSTYKNLQSKTGLIKTGAYLISFERGAWFEGLDGDEGAAPAVPRQLPLVHLAERTLAQLLQEPK